MREVELIGMIRIHPLNLVVLIACAIPGLAFPAINQEDVHFDTVSSEDSPRFMLGDVDPDAEFFVQFSRKCVGGELTVFDVAAWKVPDIGEVSSFRTPVTQQNPAVPSKDRSCHYL